VPLKKSQPVVDYRETVTAVSSMTALSKSQNKHNRIFAQAAPLGDDLSAAIESGRSGVGPHDEFKARARTLAGEFGWDLGEARKIWSFGPDGTGSNVIADLSSGVQWLNEAKDQYVCPRV